MPSRTVSGPNARPQDVELLQESARLTRAALRDWVNRLPDEMARVAGYHLGWLDARGEPVHARHAGKSVRPALVYACARAVGGRPQDAVPAAVAVELVHNFSLIHDDVIDRDRLRRHRPTVWAALGTPAALLGGDALLALASRVLAETSGRNSARMTAVLTRSTLDLIEGEAADSAFEQRDAIDEADYRAMAAGKTGALMGAACALGVLAAGGSEDRARHLTRFGVCLGVAFQIADDLLGLFGSPGRTGKPVGNDLAARKKSHPIVAALNSSTSAGRELAALYARTERLTDEQVARAVDLVVLADGERMARQAIEAELRQAFQALARAEPSAEALEDLTTLAQLMTNRSH
ncbi:polyprenyl synthetase family protein [Streptomyces sp. NPDC048484]|uniref:polyprenyl synthetase family protein n=1 Tax=Streptomyces sp. NPDC048484 TaxID=3155146 RepID=UPI00342BD324